MPAATPRVPRATYRVQLHAGFTFDDAAAIVPYLAQLGISHLYTSPVLQAVPGSTHGYDVVDHGRVNSELGGEEGFLRLADALHSRGMGLVLDIVPNHMAISSEQNRWWWDVLEHGPDSRYAGYFDVEWDPPERRLRNVVLLPVLPDHYGRVLDAGGIRLVRDADRVLVEHEGRRFPLDPRSVEPLLRDDEAVAAINADPDALDALLGAQHYRLAFWRAASEDLGYRRFFDVDALIGLRAEREEVFAATHELVLRWVAEGRVQGLRVDHPDGLRDPAGYFARLRAGAPDAWIVAEKILEADEALPADWPIDGTTGYRFANLATGLGVDAAGREALDAAWAAVADAGPDWDTILAESRSDVLGSLLVSDLNRLTELFTVVCEENRRHRDFTRHELHHALREVAAALPVYRTYARADDRHVTDGDARLVDAAVALATERRPDLDPELFDFLGRILRLEVQGPLAADLAMRFQQLTPAAMAKGVEDTAFYRHHRLVALNEVGGDPGRFGTSVAEFHAAMATTQADWPQAMLALSTHDTKRGADVRARLALLSQDPDAWRASVARLSDAARPHRPGPDLPTAADEYLFFQSLIGAWPIDAHRAAAYMEKASREAKLRTSWQDPNPQYDHALADHVRACLADPAFVAAVQVAVEPLVDAGWRAALAQVALQMTAPGVPDLYQGSELWDLTLVDPDNRRAVDHDLRRRLLADAEGLAAEEAWERRDEGVPKLWLIRRALDLRARRPAAFGAEASYQPLSAPGAVAYARGGEVVVAVPHLAWGGATVELPAGRWVGLDGATHTGTVALDELLRCFPVAILERAA